MKRITIALLAAIGVHKTLSAEQKHDVVVALAQTAPGAVAAGGAAALGQRHAPESFDDVSELLPVLTWPQFQGVQQ